MASRGSSRGFIIGLGLITGLILAFVGLARGVQRGSFAQWDVSILAAERGRASPEVTRIAIAITWLGNGEGLATVLGVLLLVFVSRRRYADALTLVAVAAGVLALEGILKPFYARPRPTPVGGYSFPSGHALRAWGVFGLLAFLLAAGKPFAWWRVLATAGCVLLAAGVCWSRLHLGVHWPTDVIAGALAATAWVTACLLVRYRLNPVWR